MEVAQQEVGALVGQTQGTNFGNTLILLTHGVVFVLGSRLATPCARQEAQDEQENERDGPPGALAPCHCVIDYRIWQHLQEHKGECATAR